MTLLHRDQPADDLPELFARLRILERDFDEGGHRPDGVRLDEGRELPDDARVDEPSNARCDCWRRQADCGSELRPSGAAVAAQTAEQFQVSGIESFDNVDNM